MSEIVECIEFILEMQEFLDPETDFTVEEIFSLDETLVHLGLYLSELRVYRDSVINNNFSKKSINCHHKSIFKLAKPRADKLIKAWHHFTESFTKIPEDKKYLEIIDTAIDKLKDSVYYYSLPIFTDRKLLKKKK